MPPEGPDEAPPQFPPELPPELATPGMLGRLKSFTIDLTPLRRSRQFRLLLIGEAVSDLGSQVTGVAVPFQVFKITHSSLAVGLLALCELFPILILAVVGGAIADRVDRRRLLRITYTILPVFSGVLAVNASLTHPQLWVMYVFAAASAGAYGLYSPAARSIPPLVVDRELLPSVFALQTIYFSTGALLGPALGGLLLATVGLAGTYLFDVGTFLVALAMLALMRPIPPVVDRQDHPALFASIREGLRFLKGKRVLQSTYSVDLIAMTFGFPRALFPAVADHLGGGPGLLGLLYAAPYAGSTVITLFSGRAKRVRRQGLATELAVVVWAMAIVVFGFSDVAWLSLLCLAVAGAGDMWSGIFRMAIAQTVVSDDMRGRIEGMGLAVWATGPTLGDVESGVVATVFNSVQVSIVSGGVATVIGVGLLMLFVPQFHRYDAKHPTP